MGDERAVEIRDALLHAAMLGIARQRRVADEAVERVARTWLVNGIKTLDSGGFAYRTLWDCLNEATRRTAELEAALATAVEQRQRVADEVERQTLEVARLTEAIAAGHPIADCVAYTDPVLSLQLQREAAVEQRQRVERERDALRRAAMLAWNAHCLVSAELRKLLADETAAAPTGEAEGPADG